MEFCKKSTVQECGAAPAGDQTAAEAAMFRKFRSGKSILGSHDHGGDGRVRVAAALISLPRPPLPPRLPDRGSPLRSPSAPPAGLRCCCRCCGSRAPSCRCLGGIRRRFSRARRGRLSALALVAWPPSPPLARLGLATVAVLEGLELWLSSPLLLFIRHRRLAPFRPPRSGRRSSPPSRGCSSAPDAPCSCGEHAAAGAPLRFAPCAPCCSRAPV
jgi:hypothetical protein